LTKRDKKTKEDNGKAGGKKETIENGKTKNCSRITEEPQRAGDLKGLYGPPEGPDEPLNDPLPMDQWEREIRPYR